MGIYTHLKNTRKKATNIYIPISIFSYCIAFINSCLHNVHINVAWFMADSSNVPLIYIDFFQDFIEDIFFSASNSNLVSIHFIGFNELTKFI